MPYVPHYRMVVKSRSDFDAYKLNRVAGPFAKRTG